MSVETIGLLLVIGITWPLLALILLVVGLTLVMRLLHMAS